MGGECFQQPLAGENNTLQISKSLVLASLSLKRSRSQIMLGEGMEEQRKPAKSPEVVLQPGAEAHALLEICWEVWAGPPGLGTAW